MVECPICGKQLESLQLLNQHLDGEHPVDSTPPVVADDGVLINDKTDMFVSARRVLCEKTSLIRTKLELRLVRLALGLQKLVGENTVGPNTGSRAADAFKSAKNFWNWQEVNAVRGFEQQIVTWEDESVFDRCRFCGQRFSFFLRKHHCRLCGLVTCGDLERECSLEVPAVLLAHKLEDLNQNRPELAGVNTTYPIRMCTECRYTLLSHRTFNSDRTSPPPPLLKLHYQLARIESDIKEVLPEFEHQLASLAAEKTSNEALVRVRKARQVILHHFAKYDTVSKRMRALDLETETDKRIQNQMLAKAALFLESSMIPLQSLPQMLRYNEPEPINKHTAKDLQNQLVVLQEQRFILETQIKEAKKKRHFDVIPPLEQSLSEIKNATKQLHKKLGTHAPST